MSKQPVRLGIISNTITPKLRELISKSDEHAQHVMVSMGVALQSWIVQSFTNKTKRIEPWKPKANGTASTLQRKGDLRQSIRVRKLTKGALVFTSKSYGQYHQFGTKSGLPRRPFFPYTKQGQLSAGAEKHLYKVGESALKSALKK